MLQMSFPFPSPLFGIKPFFSILLKFGIIRVLILKPEPSWCGFKAPICAILNGLQAPYTHFLLEMCGILLHICTEKFCWGKSQQMLANAYMFCKEGKTPIFRVLTCCSPGYNTLPDIWHNTKNCKSDFQGNYCTLFWTENHLRSSPRYCNSRKKEKPGDCTDKPSSLQAAFPEFYLFSFANPHTMLNYSKIYALLHHMFNYCSVVFYQRMVFLQVIVLLRIKWHLDKKLFRFINCKYCVTFAVHCFKNLVCGKIIWNNLVQCGSVDSYDIYD